MKRVRMGSAAVSLGVIAKLPCAGAKGSIGPELRSGALPIPAPIGVAVGLGAGVGVAGGGVGVGEGVGVGVAGPPMHAFTGNSAQTFEQQSGFEKQCAPAPPSGHGVGLGVGVVVGIGVEVGVKVGVGVGVGVGVKVGVGVGVGVGSAKTGRLPSARSNASAR